jgi:molybdopterin converting factor small subunit
VVNIKQISDLLDTGLYETFTPDREMLVADLLKELNLEDKYFGILVNGKKAEPNTKIKVTDEIVILPHIAGG